MRKGNAFIFWSTVLLFVGVCRYYAIPKMLTSRIEKAFNDAENCTFTCDDISVSLITASYTLKNVKLVTANNGIFEAAKIKVSLDARAFLKGLHITRVKITGPVIHLPSGAGKRQNAVSPGWTTAARKCFLFNVNEIDITDGEIQYHIADATTAKVLSITDIDVTLKNLQNANDDKKALPSTVEGHGKIADAMIEIDMELNEYGATPMFRLRAALRDLNLYDIRHYLRANGHRTDRHGIFSLVTQASTHRNKITGYVKPLLEDVSMASHSTNASGPVIRFAHQPVVRSLDEISFEGMINGYPVNLWDAVETTLHHAFRQALSSIPGPAADQPRSRGSVPSVKPKTNTSQVTWHKDLKRNSGYQSLFVPARIQ